MSFVQFYKDLIGAFANRNYAFLIIGFFFFMLSVGLNETYSVFVNTYFWELETRICHCKFCFALNDILSLPRRQL